MNRKTRLEITEMSSWFSKVFRSPARDVPPRSPASRTPPAPQRASEEVREPPPRRIVHAPLLVEPEAPPPGEGVHIKARLARSGDGLTFLLDRPVLPGISFVCPDREIASMHSPLAAALFSLGGVSSVTLHHRTISVWGDRRDEPELEAYAREAGRVIREHLESGRTAVSSQALAGIPPEEEVRWTLARVIENEVNPGIAAHSGRIVLNRVEGNTVYITMGGGCQGCAMSALTLRQGVERAFREAVPGLGAVLDETDHAAGTDPYFTDTPTGLG